MRPLRNLLVSAVLVILSGSFAFGVAYGATVTGTVKGPDGAPFKGAFVIARQNSKNRISVTVLSDKNGHYRVADLPAATYDIRIHAIGYKGDPQNNVTLAAGQSAVHDFALQAGVVRWSDLSLWQGKQLLPKAKGQDALFQNCFVCHGFQTRMASTTRDEDGWRDRVNYMRASMDLSPRFNDGTAEYIVTYLTSTFGPDSTKAKSPAICPHTKIWCVATATTP